MLVAFPGDSVVNLQNTQSRVSNGCLCMVMLKAAREKEWKLLEVFILCGVKSPECLGTPHLRHRS